MSARTSFPHRAGALLLVAALLAPRAAAAQSAPADSLRLGALLSAAERRDPRTRQLALREAQSALRLRSIASERLPAIAGNAQAQHQSVVTEFPGGPGAGPRALPHDTYDANVTLTEPLLDPSRAARAAAERAQLAQVRAEVLTAVYAIRRQVNASFFTLASLDARHEALSTTITDLEAQERVVGARVRNGAALAGDLAAVRAELLRRRQDDAQLLADRAAAARVLAELTGAPVDTAAPLALPALAEEVSRARAADSLRARPEYQRFAAMRESLARQADVLGAETKPRVSAFARGGAGKPGLDMLSTRAEPYWIGGVQVQWSPFDWGRSARERQALALERDVVDTEAESFREALDRATVADLATIDRLERVLPSDDEIVSLRAEIVREAAARFRESVVTSAEYVDKQTDLLAARIARAQHRVELAQARAGYLTTLGLEVR
jgi:outer membrane protein TolC